MPPFASHPQKPASVRSQGSGRANVSRSLPRAAGASASASATASATATASAAAAATDVDTAFAADLDLTGLQSPLSGMSAGFDHIPRTSFLSSTISDLDSFASADQVFHTSTAATSFASGIPDTADTVTSPATLSAPHPTTLGLETPSITGPWSHLSATGAPLPAEMLHHDAATSQPFVPPNRPRTQSSASGMDSYGDSAYWTGSTVPQAEYNGPVGTGSGGRMAFAHPHPTYPPPYPAQPQPAESLRAPANLEPWPLVQTTVAAPEEAVTADTADTTAIPGTTPSQHNALQPARSLTCRECSYHAKTQSDLKKHCARHQRAHVCHFPGCSRQTNGFATPNDLDRHLKSVHNLNNRNSKYYVCFSEGCSRASKLWPRLDNFKQHLAKMHRNEDARALLQLSEDWFQETQRQEQPESLADQADDTTSIAPSTFNFNAPPASPTQGVVGPIPAPPFTFELADPAFQSSLQHLDQTTEPAAFDLQAIDPNLLSVPMPHFATPARVQRRRTSSPGAMPSQQCRLRSGSGAKRARHRLPSPNLALRATESDVGDYPLLQDPQYSLNATDGMNAWGILNEFGVNLDQTFMAKLNRPCRYNFGDDDEIYRVPGPHTIAVPQLDPNRMADFSSPQEPQMRSDFGVRQEDILMNVGGITVTDPASPHAVRVVIDPPTNGVAPTLTPSLGKLLEDEIHSFLGEHAAKADKARQPISPEEIVNRFRLSLRSLDTSTLGGESSISKLTGMLDAAASTARTDTAPAKTRFTCRVKGCGKVKNRQSDLKKHMRRHEKPYGCTVDGCNKTFGSKNDWKRHEQGQHLQLDCWRCSQCLQVLYHHQQYYNDHMRDAHGISATAGGPFDARLHRIPRNSQGQFYCGFCVQIIVHNEHDVLSDNRRFDHIDRHFTVEKKSVQDWIELGGLGRSKAEAALALQGQPAASHMELDSPVLNDPADADSTGSSTSHGGSAAEQSLPSSLSGHSLPLPSQPPLHGGRPSHMTPSQMSTATSVPLSRGLNAPQAGSSSSVSSSSRTHRHDTASLTSTAFQSTAQRRLTRGPLQKPAEYVICCQCQCSSNFSLGKQCLDPDCLHRFCDACEIGAPWFEE